MLRLGWDIYGFIKHTFPLCLYVFIIVYLEQINVGNLLCKVMLVWIMLVGE